MPPKNSRKRIQTIQECTRRFEKKKIEEGARRMPGGLMTADAAEAVKRLIARGFAENITQAINKALIQCAADYS